MLPPLSFFSHCYASISFRQPILAISHADSFSDFCRHAASFISFSHYATAISRRPITPLAATPL